MDVATGRGRGCTRPAERMDRPVSTAATGPVSDTTACGTVWPVLLATHSRMPASGSDTRATRELVTDA